MRDAGTTRIYEGIEQIPRMVTLRALAVSASKVLPGQVGGIS
jgi:hypothetical protein